MNTANQATAIRMLVEHLFDAVDYGLEMGKNHHGKGA